MKIFKIAAAVFALAALPVFAWVGIVGAQEFKNIVGDGEVIDSTLYSTGRNVDINGTINGDVFCAGQNVRIDAKVAGDVICAGQNVTIKGEVDGDIRVAGQVVTVDANISRSITVMAQSFSLDADAVVGADATLAGDSINLKGQIDRDLLASGSEVLLSGMIGRNAKLEAPTVDVRSSAHIVGTLTYTSENDANIASGAKIVGGVVREMPEAKEQSFWGLSTAAYLYFLAAVLLIGLAVALFFPQAVRRTNKVAHKHLGKTLLVGLLAGFAIPIVAFLLAVTFVGLPLAIMMVMLWGVLIALTIPVAGYWLAGILFKKLKNTVLVMLIGTAILLTLCFLPYVGFFVALFAYWIGSGAMLIALKEHMPKPVYKG